jgi:hypothetical protein
VRIVRRFNVIDNATVVIAFMDDRDVMAYLGRGHGHRLQDWRRLRAVGKIGIGLLSDLMVVRVEVRDEFRHSRPKLRHSGYLEAAKPGEITRIFGH